ncbi:MAG: FAD-dependent oxidoreductase, partial [Pseudomonadota bacterium]
MADSERAETVVIGAGVVGLAIARALALSGREVIVLEAEDRIGSITSARNSEVIHAGIYYPTGSLKARLCVAGKTRLYQYCAERAIDHVRCGKLIVAVTEEELARFGPIAERAHANGVTDLRSISASEARALEPEVTCVGALLSPSTGVYDQVKNALVDAYKQLRIGNPLDENNHVGPLIDTDAVA